MTAVIKYVFPFCLLAISTTAFASSHAGGWGVGVVYENDRNPGSFSYELQPGDSFEDELLVSTKIPRKAMLRFYIEATPDNEMLSKWITFEKNPIVLPPYARDTVKFTVNVPSDAEKKKYEAILFSHRDPNVDDEKVIIKEEDATLALSVGTRIGMKIHLVVTDTPVMPKRFKPVPKKDDVAFYIFFSITGFGILAGTCIIFHREIKKIYNYLINS